MHAYIHSCVQVFLELKYFPVKLLCSTELYHGHMFCAMEALRDSKAKSPLQGLCVDVTGSQ